MKSPHETYRRLRNAPKPLRILAGLLLIGAGIFGFLPILGFWMVPLGLAVIFIDSPWVGRNASRLRAWWSEKVAQFRRWRAGQAQRPRRP